PNSQIISGAMSREQAAIVFNLAVKMINLNPALQPLVHIIPSGKRLVGKPCNVEYKALAAEGKTTHGLSPDENRLYLISLSGDIAEKFAPYFRP
ncbi:hypothetical protein ACUWC3_28585, partial [Klebsiella pneumoniae]